jgi:tetratricopeptide (TPR) repeat protein
LLDYALTKHYAWLASPAAAMKLFTRQSESGSELRWKLRIAGISLPVLFLGFSCARLVLCQDRASDESAFRGNRAEIAITIHDRSGEIIAVPAMVKLYHAGALAGESATSKGRAFFILNSLGDYTITVDAGGYKSVQKDISLTMAIRDEEEIYLSRDTSANGSTGAHGKPLLAPKAKEALDKGLQSLNENKLEQAQKFLDEAMKLAPGHPDVLYAEGVIYLKRREWVKAQTVLEKATQLDPDSARIFTALGMAFIDQGKYEQAIPPLERSLQLNPASSETHWTLARAYYSHERYDAALKESQEALFEAHGAAPEIELLVAQSLTAVGRYEDAAQTLRDYLKNHPKEAGATTARKWLERLAADGKIRRN